MVKYILKNERDLVIAIGTANFPHSFEDPFTAGERNEMIANTLRKEKLIEKVYIVQLYEADIDFEDWVTLIKKLSPPFDKVYTGNDLIKSLFSSRESGIEVEGIPKYTNTNYSTSLIREKIAKGEAWENLVPEPVAKVIREYQLDKRLKKLLTNQLNRSIGDEDSFDLSK